MLIVHVRVHAKGTGMSGFIEKNYMWDTMTGLNGKQHVAKLTLILIVKRGPT